jgi:hypothetical protein
MRLAKMELECVVASNCIKDCIQGAWSLVPVDWFFMAASVDLFLAGPSDEFELAPLAALAALEAAVGTEVSIDGISGVGGPGLAAVGLGVGAISRLNSVGRSIVGPFSSFSPCPWRLREAQIMISFSTR